MLVFTQQSNEATGVGKEPLSCDEYSDGIWHTHVRSSGTGTGKWTMTDQSMAIDDGSSTCRKKVVLQLLTAYMNLLGNIRSGRKTRWKQNSFLTWISTLSKSSFTQLQYIMKFFCIDDEQFSLVVTHLRDRGFCKMFVHMARK
uniref:Uncharacterized protein n=1 Tax=Solanum tuberosum TaxID=4113 RepID=M1DLN6_SOLTU